ncbi:MAG: type II toxin-antitoxin system PemK/MazF family toxin [Lachnospiraceae bacterium]|nr:type II toxin-antitoxin system PemK/MazF family toxin [Lachnospiraceae bacterium]
MNKGEVWFVEFSLEEDSSRILNRPVVVLDENLLGVLSVKITKHKVRKEDPYDTPIIYWEDANLRLASTARVSKVILLTKDSFIFKIGNLHNDDLKRIEDMYKKFLEDNGAI